MFCITYDDYQSLSHWSIPLFVECHSALASIVIEEDDGLELFGVVTSVVHSVRRGGKA
jgi:hypothetical protein